MPLQLTLLTSPHPEEELESTTVKEALDSLAHQNIKEVFSALFHQILHGSGSVRRHSLNWIQANVPRLGDALIHPHNEVEQHLSGLIKQVCTQCHIQRSSVVTHSSQRCSKT